MHKIFYFQILEQESSSKRDDTRSAGAWLPTILIVWQELTPSENPAQLSLLRTTFNDSFQNLDFNSKCFVVFPEVKKSCHFDKTTWEHFEYISLWEMYRLKRQFVISHIFRIAPYNPDMAQWNHPHFYLLGTISLQGFVKRRRNFQQEKFTATVKRSAIYRKEWTRGFIQKRRVPYSDYVSLDYWDLQDLLNFR